MQERIITAIKNNYERTYEGATIYDDVDAFDFVVQEGGNLRFVIVRTFDDRLEFFAAVNDVPMEQKEFEAYAIDFLLLKADGLKSSNLELDVADFLPVGDGNAMLRVHANVKFA